MKDSLRLLFRWICRSLAGIALMIPWQVTAADWKTWDTLRPDTKTVDAKFAPDGTLRILFTEESSSSPTAPLILKLAKFSKGAFSFSEVTQLGPAGAEPLDQNVRLIGDHRSMWAVWRRAPATGNALIHAARIFPESPSINIETIQSGGTTRFFDAALGADGQPRVALINEGAQSVTVARRTAAGTWQKKTSLEIPAGDNESYFELALASRENRLVVVLTTVKTGPPTQSPRYFSRLLAYSAGETTNWSSMTFGSPGTLVGNSSNSSLPFASEPTAKWLTDDVLHVAYVAFFQESLRVTSFDFRTNAVAEVSSLSKEFGGWNSPGLGASVNTGTHVAAPDSSRGDSVSYLLRENGNTRINDTIPGLVADSLDLELDSDGNPWLVTRHPNENLLQVTTLKDVTDEDNDGVPYLAEQALLMNPEVADAEKLPKPGFVIVGGQRYPSLTLLSRSSGTGNNPYLSPDYSYRIEISDNLLDWSAATSDIILEDRFSITGRGTVSTYRSTTPVAFGEFFRLVIRRR